MDPSWGDSTIFEYSDPPDAPLPAQGELQGQPCSWGRRSTNAVSRAPVFIPTCPTCTQAGEVLPLAFMTGRPGRPYAEAGLAPGQMLLLNASLTLLCADAAAWWAGWWAVGAGWMSAQVVSQLPGAADLLCFNGPAYGRPACPCAPWAC